MPQYLGVTLLTRLLPAGNFLEETERKENSIDSVLEADNLNQRFSIAQRVLGQKNLGFWKQKLYFTLDPIIRISINFIKS